MGSKVYLPGSEICEIPPEKIRLYLLNHEHIVGRSKAKFFNSVGLPGKIGRFWRSLLNSMLRKTLLPELNKLILAQNTLLKGN